MDRCYKGGKMIIAIDPGGTKPHALAYFNQGKLDFVYKSDYIRLISKAINYANRVFIENQYGGKNRATVILLSHRTGMLMGLCKLHETPYEMVAPVTWQSWHKIPRKPKDITDYKWKKLHKQHQIEKAEELTGHKPEDEDEAAAILIGYWAIHREHE